MLAILVFALPDGETGPRSAWVGYERERLVRPNPGVVVTEETMVERVRVTEHFLAIEYIPLRTPDRRSQLRDAKAELTA